MTPRHPRQLDLCLATALVSGVLVGCGGGSSPSPVDVTRNTNAEVPELVTMPEYKALRTTVVSVTGGVVPTESEQATLRTANHQTAVNQLLPNLNTAGANAAAVPPLTSAVVRTLAAAASGDTLAQITARFDVAPSPFVASLQTGSVASQFWTDKGRRLRTVFLASTDTLGPFGRLADWAGNEAQFSSGAYSTDEALKAALTALHPFLTPRDVPAPAGNTRLLVGHQVTSRAQWAGLVPFDGVFDRGLAPHNLLSMPMLRVTAGVKRFTGTDFTADVLPLANGQRLVSLRPNTGTLPVFAAGRLPAAISELAQGALAPGAALPDGEIVLPQQDITLNFTANAPIAAAGVTLAFDEANANMRNLDGAGGTFANPVFSSASVQISPAGLTLKAMDLSAFTFSNKNLFGGVDGFSLTSVNTTGNLFAIGYANFDLFTCNWPATNLRSFFLAVMDANRWVVSLSAIQSPSGNAVQPGKAAYNPWPNDSRWVINSNLQGTIPSSVTQPFVVALVGAPAPPPPPVYSDVLAEAAQYGFFLDASAGVYKHSSCATQ